MPSDTHTHAADANNRSESPSPHSRTFLRANLIFWPITVAGLALDLWTKKAVFEWLAQKHPPVAVIFDGFLRFVIRENPGAAFGIAGGRREFLIAVSVVALIIILAVFLTARPRRILLDTALALFAAGVLGNLYDRLFYEGKVRDFIDLHYHQYHWPAFNLADTMLCIAVGLCLLAMLTAPPSNKPDPEPPPTQK